MPDRCPECPVPAGLGCRGESLRHACARPAYRELFGRLAGGDGPAPRPVSAGSKAPRPALDGEPSDDELLANAEACPHRVPMPEGERTSCGCRHKCLEGLGPRWRKGGVLLADCWDCELTPRRSRPAPSPPPEP